MALKAKFTGFHGCYKVAFLFVLQIMTGKAAESAVNKLYGSSDIVNVPVSALSIGNVVVVSSNGMATAYCGIFAVKFYIATFP